MPNEQEGEILNNNLGRCSVRPQSSVRPESVQVLDMDQQPAPSLGPQSLMLVPKLRGESPLHGILCNVVCGVLHQLCKHCSSSTCHFVFVLQPPE